jgi:tRNA (guanine-N7-)-methyltransferase
MTKRPRESDTAIMTEAGPSTVSVLEGGAGGATNGEALLKVPQKRFYRQRAHANVFVDHLLD